MSDLRYFVGLDLGQARDFTALTILSREAIRPGAGFPVYSLRYLHRFELGTPYPQIVAAVAAILTRPPLSTSWVALAVDKTGVGFAVCDMLRTRFPSMYGITITGGREVGIEAGGFSVPKVDLVSTMQVLLQNRRLKISPNLANAEILAQELQTFRAKINVNTGHESFESWREKDHDDLVLAVAMAAWLGERAAADECRSILDAIEQAEMYGVADRRSIFA